MDQTPIGSYVAAVAATTTAKKHAAIVDDGWEAIDITPTMEVERARRRLWIVLERDHGAGATKKTPA